VERRSLFDLIFGKPKTYTNQTQLKMLNGYSPTYTPVSDNAYDSDVVRTAVDTIARHAAKLKPKHVRYVQNGIQTPESKLERILQYRPNPYMNYYTFMYKVVTQLYLQNNAFIYIDKSPVGGVISLYPVNYSSVELLQVGKEVYAKFNFFGGQQITLPYEELIHLRRFFYKDDFFGDTSSKVLFPTLQLIQTTNDGIINAIKSSASLRGILKFSAMLKPDDMKKQRDLFVTDYLDIANNGGVVVTDTKAEYSPIANEPKMIDAKQMELIEEKVYKFFNVSREIVTSNYTEDQMNAFYSSVIEPIAIQMSLEFTNKLFTNNERNHGNEIIFSANRLTFAENKTKVSMASELLPLGVFNINEIREVFELEPVEGGDKRIQTLNVVNADQADQYQLGGASDEEGQRDETVSDVRDPSESDTA
jgi:HK97 family phage portal protein